ncbi:MAG: heme exporter protein CcmB [Phycisphaeraceae bacterium]|nr:heme exporter protein CcmB [Phycisphaeraceae bacterium]
MTTTLGRIMLLVAKDLRIEARGRQTIAIVLVLGILIIVVLGIGFGSPGSSGQPVTGFQATAILWVAYFFGGVLCFEKTMDVERRDDALAGLLMTPVDRGAIYVAKLLTNLTLIAGLTIVITPLAVMFFRFDLAGHAGAFVAILALGMVGFAAIGTLFAAAASSTRLQGGLLAMLVFPLCLPVVIVSTQMMRELFLPGGQLSMPGLALLAGFDLMALTVGWLVFEQVLEP